MTSGATTVASHRNQMVPVPQTASRQSSANQQSVSSDGRYVAFSSNASNLVANDTNGKPDVFVRDLVTGTTRLVSPPVVE